MKGAVMNHLSKLCTNKRFCSIIQPISMAITSALMFYPLFAADGQTIWDTAQGAGNQFWNKLQNLYCYALFLPLFLLSLAIWAIFAKDDKSRATFAKAMKIECAAFIIMLIPTIITGTLTQFAGWLNGTH